ncbi:hypothetical protein IKT18_03565 [Candidatus Saccharibacteria bacterium]|nr:hypothetical protein [Candidatus Saccharibacteria bacterium]
MKKTKPEQPKKITMKLAFLGALFVLGGLIGYYGFQDSENLVFKVVNDNVVDYRVFLKPNDFFDEPYLNSGKTYITSLIDHIDIDFKHSEHFSENASGKISYFLQATISADRTSGATGDGTYWSRDFQLTEPTTIDFENTDHATFNTTIPISYSYYNSILESFRAQYPVASEGTLKISLLVNSAIEADGFEDPLGFKAESSLNLPLLERAVEAKVNVNAGGKTQEFTTSIETTNAIFYLIMKIIGPLIMIIATICAILLFAKRRAFIKNNQYISTLDKIFGANDSIITNIENVPNFAKFQKFEVQTFDELLDAYNEIRLPINYYQNKSGTESTFFIANDNIVWIYRLRKRDLGS